VRQNRWEEGRGTREARVPGAKGRASASGLTLVEVLMSLMVTGIGVLGVVALLPLAFVRAVQATNLTNGTILRYNAESMLTVNQRLLLRWQPNQQYQVGDIVLVPTIPGVGFQCTAAGTSGLVQPAWVATVPGTTTENPLTTNTPVWATQNNLVQSPTGNPPPRYVIDPMGWYALGATLQGSLGNNGAATPAPDPAGIARYNGETPSAVAAAMQAYLPDSWTEQSRAPVSATTVTSATLMNVDLSAVAYSPVGQSATVAQPYTISRIVLIDATGKVGHTRIITNIATPASSPVVSWSSNDPLPTGFTAATARVEMQEARYTWMLTVMPSTSSILANIQVTVFFNRTPTALEEQVYQEQTGNADGVTTPFHFAYTPGKKPFVKKGSFVFDCYFGRWYRVVNVLNDTGSAFDIIVDQPRQQADMLLGATFGAVFMPGVVDVFPITPQ
jgi:Tfp pilus assembly protein PilV